MRRGTPLSPPPPAGGVEVAKMGDRGTAAEGAAGANDENSRGAGNSPRIIIPTVMTTSIAGTGASTSYLHSSSSRNPGTNSNRSSFPGIVGVAAGASHHSSITTPVTAWAGAACYSNSPTVLAGKDASCIIKRKVVLVVAGAGGNYGALMVEVTWGAGRLTPLARNLTAGSNRGDPLMER